MKLSVLGPTGGTGKELVRQALTAGHEVVALTRDRRKIDSEHQRLRVVEGDALLPEHVSAAVKGADAVVSALGIGYRRHTTTVYSHGTRNVMAAMRTHGVSRLLVVSTSSLHVPDRSQFAEWLVARLVLQPLLKRPYADIRRMEEQVTASGHDWTLVRASRLTDGGHTGDYRTATNRKLRGCWSISRADVAHYVLTHLEDTSTYRAAVEIAY